MYRRVIRSLAEIGAVVGWGRWVRGSRVAGRGTTDVGWSLGVWLRAGAASAVTVSAAAGTIRTREWTWWSKRSTITIISPRRSSLSMMDGNRREYGEFPMAWNPRARLSISA